MKVKVNDDVLYLLKQRRVRRQAAVEWWNGGIISQMSVELVKERCGTGVVSQRGGYMFFFLLLQISFLSFTIRGNFTGESRIC